MDMNADTTSIAARRVEMERIKPITRKSHAEVENRLRPNSVEDSTEHKKSSPEQQDAYEAVAHDEQAVEHPTIADGEEHILDVRA